MPIFVSRSTTSVPLTELYIKRRYKRWMYVSQSLRLTDSPWSKMCLTLSACATRTALLSSDVYVTALMIMSSISDSINDKIYWRFFWMHYDYLLACPDNDTAFYELLLCSLLNCPLPRKSISRLELQQIKLHNLKNRI